MSKKIGIIILVSAILIPTLIIAYFFTFKVKNVNSEQIEFKKYISAYTSGVISKTSSIKIKLLSDVVSEIDKTKQLPKGLLKFSPSVDGEYSWIDDYTIEFQPSEKLKSGQEYFVKFALGDLLDDLDSDLKTFNFTFQTLKQSFDIVVEEHKTLDKSTLKWQQALGHIQMADYEELEDVEKILNASQSGKKLSINWVADFDNYIYYFTIDSIARTEEETTVRVVWDGTKIGVDKAGSEIITIYAIDDFNFIAAKVIQQPEQYLQLQFSDPLLEDQELKGLITISNFDNLRYIIEDNIIKVYPSKRIDGVFDVFIADGVKNILGYKLKSSQNLNLAFEKIKPAVRLLNAGAILPSSESGLIFPFEAVNLKAVDVTIIKIYEDNVMQFLQVNNFSGESELIRVGEPILRKTISLENQDIVDYGKWNRFTFDLSELIATEPGAIYRIEIGFRQYQSLYECDEIITDEGDLEETDWSEEDYNWTPEFNESSYWDYYDDYYWDYYWDDDYWDNRENPCNKAYYTSDRTVAQNLIASDIGLIAKKGNDGSLKIFANNILTTEPIDNAEISIYNYQSNLLETQSTGTEGYCSFEALENPYFIVAEYDGQKGYLKIDDGSSLPISHFDISGTSVNEGVKGFIYTERGVWRPGDSIYITFILKEEQELPDEHPIVFNFQNPQYQTITKITKTKNSTGFYSFPVATDVEDVTGNYHAYVTIGAAEFYKKIKVETIKPNRLKINLDVEKEYLSKNEKTNAQLEVKWLQGTIAKNLDAEVEVTFEPSSISFSQFGEYIFDDPSKSFYSDYEKVFDGSIDNQGKASFDLDFSISDDAPGKLNATFVTRAYEQGGNFSISQFAMPYFSYDNFVGIKIPKGDKMRGMLLTDTNHTVDIVLVDKDGNKITKDHEIKMEFMKLDWNWWMDDNDGSSSYVSTSYATLIADEKITSKSGIATWNIRVDYPDWGRYFVRATDLETGHSTGKVVFIDWPGWAGKAQREGKSATMLSFSTDKDVYNVNEKIKVSFPSSKGGRALINIETGTKTINSYWVETKDLETNFEFFATDEMSPNIFINVTLLQPHVQTANDLPIRLYGILPVTVENPETHLEPVITMPDILESESTFEIKISEKDSKPMTYTIAIVDEGLLDLTSFKTPNPWDEFYKKEALGVKTWDLYDWIIGAYGGQIEKLISIGGDSEVDRESKSEANRFEPVVMYLGPFEYTGGINSHSVTLPNYIGSVRTMVIAGKDIAYGSSEKTTPVIKPLMLLGTLPRVLGPGEKAKLPVSVFALGENIKNVSVSLSTNDFFTISGSSTKSVKFKEEGEEYLFFDLEVAEKIGIGQIEIVATSGNEKASYSIEIEVRNPNTEQTDVIANTIEAQKSWETTIIPFGMTGTNTAILEVSSVPPLDIEKRLNYLITYPYGCVEQTTSAVFAQLYLNDIMELSSEQKSKIETNIKAGISSIVEFQTSSGGLSYWKGGTEANAWGTNYAGHFMIEAQNKGYAVPNSFIKNWKEYQKTKAKNWNETEERSQFVQAYRLYTLALAGDAEIGAMNRLKELKNLEDEAKWHLAAAYYLAGKQQIAKDLIINLSKEVEDYKELSYTFGTATRDKAIILETLTLLQQNTDAFEVINDISNELSSNDWLGTQTIAYALIAVSKYYKSNESTSPLQFTYTFNGNSEKVSSDKNFISKEIEISELGEKTILLENNTEGVLYARIITKGIPIAGQEKASENKLKISVIYKLLDGTAISPENITQGTDFVAEVKVTNTNYNQNYERLALTQIFPSGWEIINTRLFDIGSFENSSDFDYQDIRDDRVYTFFDLNKNNTKTFRVLLNATYEGEFYLSPVYCEVMYDGTINARNTGKWIKISE